MEEHVFLNLIEVVLEDEITDDSAGMSYDNPRTDPCVFPSSGPTTTS